MLELKIEGVDQLDKAFEEVSQALESLKQQIGAVRFNPADPNDVDRAIGEAQRMVDARLWRFKHNPWVSTISNGLKEKIREGILEKARQATGGDSAGETSPFS